MEEDYKKRELDSKFQYLEDKMKEKHEDIMNALNDIKEAVSGVSKKQDYTNGKVAKHEIWMRAFWWFFGFIGALIVLSIPLFKYVILNEIHNASESAVNDAFDTRFSNIEVIEWNYNIHTQSL